MYLYIFKSFTFHPEKWEKNNFENGINTPHVECDCLYRKRTAVEVHEITLKLNLIKMVE